MHLQSISLTNFRNYKQADITFDPNVNLIIGENAQGKTNMMEAIFTLAMTKGHRAQKDKELIRWEEKYARIKGIVEKKSGKITLEISISSNGKKAKLNSLEQKKLSDYIGALNVVMFAPEDLNIVKGNPGIRRRFLDMEIGQIQPVYIHDLNQFHKILQQRNALLKELQKAKERQKLIMLDILTESLTDFAAKVVQRRLSFLTRLQELAQSVHLQISRGEEKLKLRYLSSVDQDVSEQATLSKIVEAYENKFVKIKDREIERGITLIGPHRDDILFFVNGKNVQTYGSQGQKRTTALAVKLAEIELIKEEIGEYPLLLLDDVLSELDDHRQTHLLNAIHGKVQTFVTTTNIDGIHHETLQKATRYFVSKGEIEIYG